MKYSIIIILVFLSKMGIAQLPDLKSYDCPTSSYANSEKFIQYYKNNQLDSAQYIVNDWVEKCGQREVVIRAQTLLHLKSKKAVEVNENSFFTLIEFIQRDTITGIRTKYFYEYNRPYYGYIPISESYDNFTKEAFKDLPVQESDELELLRKVYSGDYASFFNDIKILSAQGESEIQNSYYEYLNTTLKTTELHYSFLSGVWIPLSNTTLGSHPEIGFQLGPRRRDGTMT